MAAGNGVGVPADLVVIDLNSFEIECAVCAERHAYPSHGRSLGVPMFEGEILADNDAGDWGGQPVCPRCYYLVRGLQSEAPYNRARLPVHVARELAAVQS